LSKLAGERRSDYSEIMESHISATTAARLRVVDWEVPALKKRIKPPAKT
jgi:hypothetical protein